MAVIKHKTREATCVFTDVNHMREAIEELKLQGFERRQISVVGSEWAMKEAFGEERVKPEKLLDHPDAPRSPDVAPEELGVAQGVLVGIGLAAGVGVTVALGGGFIISGLALTEVILGGLGGSAVGAGLAKVLGDQYVKFFEEQIKAGGLVLWVQTDNKEQEKKALKILKDHHGQHVHAHTLAIQREA